MKSTSEQRLPDGSYIRGWVHTQEARDSAGRAMGETTQGCTKDENGALKPELNVTAYDPTAKTTTFWQTGENWGGKIARVSHQPDAPRKLPTPAELAAQQAQQKFMQMRQPPRSEYKREDLGMQTIGGYEARGTRTTQTIPPGDEGDELPLVIVNETWRSRDFGGITLMGIRDDPRRGRTTYEVEEISNTEPDPTLFAPPAGYKTIDPKANAAAAAQ